VKSTITGRPSACRAATRSGLQVSAARPGPLGTAGVPVATVHTRLSRALEKLRARLDREHGGKRRAWLVPVAGLAGRRTVQLGLANFQGAHLTNWTLLMAGNVMSLAPMLIVFIVAQRFFVRSIAASGIKG